MTKKIKELEDVWYFDSYALRHIYNKKRFFSNLWSKNYEVVTVEGKIIRFKKRDSIRLPTCSKLTITFNNYAYTPRYDFILIFLGQLQKSGIFYHNYLKQIILRQGEKSIRLASRFKYLFILDIEITDKTMIIQEKRCLTELQSQNLYIRLWHHHFWYANTLKIV